jgi:hypothetical protein
MTDTPSFSYRLPLTYVRVTGTKRTLTDSLTETSEVERTSTVTTEIGADLLTRCQVRLSPDSMATQKSTWKLLPDGRLTGADVATTTEPLAVWKASLAAGISVLTAAGPALISMGPPGWIALAGAVGVAAAGTGISLGQLNLFAHRLEPDPDADSHALPQTADPAEWDVHPRYVEQHPMAAETLATYRAALAAATAAHARYIYAAIHAGHDDEGARGHWEKQLESVERGLASASVGARRAEAAYAQWRSEQVAINSIDVDERFRVDDLPDRTELHNWAAGQDAGSKHWTQMAKDLRVAVSVSLEAIPGDNQRLHRVEYQPGEDYDKVRYRQPRPAVLEVWEVIPASPSTSSTAHTLHRVDVRRIFVAYPGNEAVLSLETGHDSNNAVAVGFDESGALTSITTEITDPSLQRAREISAILPTLTAAVEAGSGLRKALAPPSLVERAAEAKAAQELGMVELPVDPLRQLKDQLAEARLRAQLKLAEQLASSTSQPVMVTVSETLES